LFKSFTNSILNTRLVRLTNLNFLWNLVVSIVIIISLTFINRVIIINRIPANHLVGSLVVYSTTKSIN